MPSIWLSSSSRDTRFSMRPAPHFLVILFWSYSTIGHEVLRPRPNRRRTQAQAPGAGCAPYEAGMVPVRKFSARRRLIIWLEVTPGSDPVSMLPEMSRYPSCCILLTVLGTSPVRPLAKPSCKASTLSEHRDRPLDTDSE